MYVYNFIEIKRIYRVNKALYGQPRMVSKKKKNL